MLQSGCVSWDTLRLIDFGFAQEMHPGRLHGKYANNSFNTIFMYTLQFCHV